MPSFNTVVTQFAFNWHSWEMAVRGSQGVWEHIHLTPTECQVPARSLHPLSLWFLNPKFGILY